MSDTYVQIPDLPVMRVKADMKGKGPSAAFQFLESKLPTLNGRKFYGTFQFTSTGEEYYACVVTPRSFRGGSYARRNLLDWEKKISQLPRLFREMVQSHEVDPSRPFLEFYRSHAEMQLLVPVLGTSQQGPT